MFIYPAALVNSLSRYWHPQPEPETIQGFSPFLPKRLYTLNFAQVARSARAQATCVVLYASAHTSKYIRNVGLYTDLKILGVLQTSNIFL